MQNQKNMIRFIKHRSAGNCFVNCIIQALTNLGDNGVSGKKSPELAVFDLETLNSPKPEREFEPALNYLISNGYQVKIIDPDPFRDGNFGINLKYAQVQCPPRSYEMQDIEDLLNDGWQVIISTEASMKPHAVLIAENLIYDPIDETKWQQVSKKTNDLLQNYINMKKERFLIGIKK